MRTEAPLDTLDPPVISDQAKAYAHYAAALRYLKEDNRESAIEELEQVLRYDPVSERAATSLALLYSRSGRLQDAMKVLEDTVAAGARSSTIHIMLGNTYQQQGRRADAERELRRATELGPDNAASFVYLGDVLKDNNDLVDATWAYEQAARLQPDSYLVRQKLGLAYTEMEDFDRAAVELKSATDLQPASSESSFNLGIVLIHQGKTDEAERPLLIALGRNPSSIPVRRVLAGLYCQLERWQEAGDQYAAIAKLRPNNEQFTEEMAVVQILSGEYSQAIETLKSTGGATSASAFTRVLNAGATLRLGRTDEAVEQAGQILSFADDTPIFTMIGTISLFGKPRMLIMYRALFQELIDEGARSGPLNVFLGRLLENAGNIEAAAAAMEDALAVDPDSELAQYYAGAIYDKLHDREKAIEHLKRAIEIGPGKAEYYNHLGYLYAENNIHLDKAFELLSKALELDPDNGYMLDSIAWVYYQRGEYDKALEYIRRALPNVRTDDAVIREHLGDVLFALGRKEEALAEWRKAIRLDPSVERVREKIEKHAPVDIPGQDD
jgi:tetratricopeptide (TPR) repeat protein